MPAINRIFSKKITFFHVVTTEYYTERSNQSLSRARNRSGEKNSEKKIRGKNVEKHFTDQNNNRFVIAVTRKAKKKTTKK